MISKNYYSFSHWVLIRTVEARPSYLRTSNPRRGDSCNRSLRLQALQRHRPTVTGDTGPGGPRISWIHGNAEQLSAS